MKTSVLKRESGFTLIEILIVLILIAVLASVAIPRYLGQQERGHVAEAIGILSAIRRGEEVFFNDNAQYLAIPNSTDTSWQRLGLQPPSNSNFWNFSTTTGAIPYAIATRKGTVGGTTGCAVGQMIRLRLNSTSGDPWQDSNGCYATAGAFHPAN